MSLIIKDIDKIMEQHAPARFKESYDNVGLMLGDKESEITSILVALDCTLDVIQEAKKKDCNLILTHHPLLFKKPTNITTDTLLGKKIIELIKSNINVYSSHTNLDSVKGGINELIMEIIGFNKYYTISPSERGNDNDRTTGIGRIAEFDEAITLEEMCEKVKESLNIPFLRYSGDDSMKIKKVAVINGSGQDYFNVARRLGADCIVTGDTTYHYVSDFNEEGIGIIDAGHFDTEWPAMKFIAKWLKGILETKGFDNLVLVSEASRNPYKYK